MFIFNKLIITSLCLLFIYHVILLLFTFLLDLCSTIRRHHPSYDVIINPHTIDVTHIVHESSYILMTSTDCHVFVSFVYVHVLVQQPGPIVFFTWLVTPKPKSLFKSFSKTFHHGGPDFLHHRRCQRSSQYDRAQYRFPRGHEERPGH